MTVHRVMLIFEHIVIKYCLDQLKLNRETLKRFDFNGLQCIKITPCVHIANTSTNNLQDTH